MLYNIIFGLSQELALTLEHYIGKVQHFQVSLLGRPLITFEGRELLKQSGI